MDALATLASLDRDLFFFINSKASSTSIDWLMKTLRHALTWIPLYAFILYWILSRRIQHHTQNAVQRNSAAGVWAYAIPFILLSLVSFAITDFTSASILKPLFARPRPCYASDLPVVRDLVGCGGKFGMPSTHASNHFGLAAFWYNTIAWSYNRRWWWLWLWAFMIGYAQVYVGKHYPGDILVGAILGICVGALLAILFKKWMTKAQGNEKA